ncbi:Uncharacterised protein [Mycobacteroides abscessus subsp. massiliense]|nr:Uncharacterised protein [Mycobacteroides abscessus subsp. massiliense]
MLLAALSIASSRALACVSADSAPRMASTRLICWPSRGRAASSRPCVMRESAKRTRSVASAMLSLMDANAASSNSVRSWPRIRSDSGIRAVTATTCCVRVSSLAGALITKFRSASKALDWSSRVRSARAAVVMTSISSRRCSSGVSGIASSSCLRTENAWASAFFAESTAC